MTAIYCSATFAAAITAISINTPGTAANATTCLDGYPLAQRGEAGRALDMAVFSSAIGGVFSIIYLMIAAPSLARAAYNFSRTEYFALTLCSLSMLASIGDGSTIKNLIARGLEIFLALVGVDNLTTVERFTFGSFQLYEGIKFVPVMIGVFGISELLIRAVNLQVVREQVIMKAITLPSRADCNKSWHTIVRSSGIGTFIGILPAEGATVAAMIGYNEAKRWTKNPVEFGHVAIEGIAGSEAANNAAMGGAMVPTLALDIPSSATAAVILAGLMVHGVRPGPTMFTEQAESVYAIFWSMLLVNILFFLVGLRGAKVLAGVTLILVQILWPTVFVFSIDGTYALDQSIFDVWVALTAGVVGVFMHHYGFSDAPLAIGLILGGMLEQRLGQPMMRLDEKWWLMFTRPLTLFFFILTALALFGQALFGIFKRRLLNSTGGTAE